MRRPYAGSPWRNARVTSNGRGDACVALTRDHLREVARGVNRLPITAAAAVSSTVATAAAAAATTATTAATTAAATAAAFAAAAAEAAATAAATEAATAAAAAERRRHHRRHGSRRRHRRQIHALRAAWRYLRSLDAHRARHRSFPRPPARLRHRSITRRTRTHANDRSFCLRQLRRRPHYQNDRTLLVKAYR